MNKSSIIGISIVFALIILGGGFFYFSHNEFEGDSNSNSNVIEIDRGSVTAPISEKNINYIIVPENAEKYKNQMAQYSRTGGDNPLNSTKFKKKFVSLTSSEQPMKTLANAAANEFQPAGNSQKAQVAYFKLMGTTAYILLNIDIDSQPKISVSQEIIHPIIKKSLLEFPSVKNVDFSFAPGDSPKTISN